jgi:4-hydroxy-2-oxoheptanedioate aldolase
MSEPQSELHARIREKKLLVGTTCETGAPMIAELCGIVGGDIIWLDLEHGTAGWRDAQAFCQAAQAGGALPALRVPGAERTHIMHALEIGAKLVIVPMVNNADTARKVVEFGKYPPIGQRGFAGSTRAMSYGTGDAKQNVAKANRETHLFVQIETMDAVRNCAEIVSVEGISGGLVGPADLSFSMGKPLDFENPEFLKLFGETIRTIRGCGKIAATAAGNPKLIDIGLEAGLQILICATEAQAVRQLWGQMIKDIRAKVKV